MALVCGEITADCYVDIPQVVRNTIKNIGYVGSNAGGFDADTCAVLTSIDEQSTVILEMELIKHLKQEAKILILQ